MNGKMKAPKLSAFEKKIVKAIEHMFSVGGWEIPDSCVSGKFTNKLRELESRVNQLAETPTVRRLDTVAAMRKGGAK